MKLDTLKAMKVWVPFMLVPEGDRMAKKPSFDGIHYAKWKKESHLLMTYADAKSLAESTSGLPGVGFVIPPGPPGYAIAVVDLDDSFNENGNLKPSAQTIVDQLRSYTEYSPSGKGLHVVTVASLAGFTKKTFHQEGQSVEILLPGNFCTFTGKIVGQESDINDCTPILLDLYEKAGIQPSTYYQPPMGGGYGQRCQHESEHCPYGLAALESECKKVRPMRYPGRTNALFKAAATLGQLVASGHLDEAQVYRELTRAGHSTGLSSEKCKATIRDGMARGKTQPRNVDCKPKSKKLKLLPK